MSKKDRHVAYAGTSLLMLAALLFVGGCAGGPAGPPGATPGMTPPGVPGSAPPGLSSGAPTHTPNHPPLVAQGAAKPAVPAPPGSPVTTNTDSKAPDTAKTPASPSVIPPGLPTAPPGVATGSDSKNPLGPVSKVEQAGNTVELASNIAPDANPFMNKLPKPIVPEKPATTGDGGTASSEPPPPPADPFESVGLVGIVYNSKSPLALLSVSGGENQNQLVRKGDLIMVDGGQIKVSQIKPDGIEVESMTDKQKKTLSLPSIIGFGASDTGTKSTDAAKTGDNTKFAGSGSDGAKGADSKKDPSLPNLKKLSRSNPADVKLQEP